MKICRSKLRFIPSDELENGQSIITKVIVPQVNFNGVMIGDGG